MIPEYFAQFDTLYTKKRFFSIQLYEIIPNVAAQPTSTQIVNPNAEK
jgi:hypothetical protein